MRHSAQSCAFILLLLAGICAGEPPSGKAAFQLVGKIEQPDGKPFRGVHPVVFLHGAVTPFVAQTLADANGTFKFKGLPAATYTLVVAVPRAGELRRTIEIGPSFADAKRRIRASLTFERNIPRDKSLAVSTVELSVPLRAQSEYDKAQLALRRRDVPRAKKNLQSAVKLAPQFSAAWNNLGTIAYQERDYQEAERLFREALRQEPDSYPPLVNLGGTLLSQGKPEDAFPLNSKAVDRMPQDPLAQSQLGQNFFILGQFIQAERHLKQAKALDPSHFSHPQLTLAKIYEARRDISSLIHELEEFLELHPDSEKAHAIRKSLDEARTRTGIY